MRIGVALVAGIVLLAAVTYGFAQVLAPLPAAKAERQGPEPAFAPVQVAESSASPARERLNAASEIRAEPPDAHSDDPLPLPGGPVVAIVMTEMGMDPSLDRQVIAALPPEITFAFSPYGERAPQLASRAAADGHEVLVSIPMEPNSYPAVNPGENTLLANAAAEENLSALDWALGSFGEVNGATGMMGSRFTRSAAALQPVMKDLHMRGLAFIDQRAVVGSVAEEEARASGVPSRTNDSFIDEPSSRASIERRLASLSRIAKQRGYAIGYARPLPETVAALNDYAARSEAEGITLVGAARLVRGLPEDG